MKEESTTVAVVLPESMVAWLDEKARANDGSRSQAVRAVLRKVMEDEE